MRNSAIPDTTTKKRGTDDSRNGYSKKTVTSSIMGNIDIDIPRDRKDEFEPQVVKKYQTDISNIEDQVLSMYAKGMTTRDISMHLREVYGVDAPAEMITHMTDWILPIVKEWQNRPLDRKYAVVFMDLVHFHVREDNKTVKKAVYVAIGVNTLISFKNLLTHLVLGVKIPIPINGVFFFVYL